MLIFVPTRSKSPLHKMRDIFCHLTNGCWGSIIKLQHLVMKRRRHSNLSSSKVRIVMHIFRKCHSSRGSIIPRQKREKIIRTSMSRSDQQSQTWWESTIVSKTGSFLVRVYLWERIGDFSRSFSWFSSLIGVTWVVIFSSICLCLFFQKNCVDKLAIANTVHTVTCRTYFFVHLVSSSKAGGIISKKLSGHWRAVHGSLKTITRCFKIGFQ
mmetsp:Transcript_30980/g.42626  ORF Transcript_30980/g.42626 Transcript_30980/m.42626 type:complete len:211 (+) Transcript_30980:174-806(+)